ncbi:MAG TPA: glycosyltransferase family 9 protein [Ktedonobacterales bacterium]
MRTNETIARPPDRAWMSHRIPTDPKRILVGLISPIGDTLLATPALAALRRAFSTAEIAALVAPSNAGILSGNPDVDRLIYAPASGTASQTRRYLDALRALRHEQFDLIISFSGISALTARLTHPRTPRMFLDLPRWWFLAGGDTTLHKRHAVDQYLRTLAPLVAAPPADPEARVPRIHLTAQERAQARELLREEGIAAASPLIAMHLGGDGFNGRKRWAPERFAAVANALVERHNAQVIFLGGAEDIERSREAAALVDRNAHVLAGRCSLKVTAALIERATLYIGNDSAPLHIAGAVGTPAVGIFGPSDWVEFAPASPKAPAPRVVHSDLACSPCFRFVGNDPMWKVNSCYSFACLNAITPEAVLATATDLLTEAQGEAPAPALTD